VKKGLVTRSDDPEDRRLVICELSVEGQALINRLWMLSRGQIEKLLQGLTLEQLKKADEVVGFILANAKANLEQAQRRAGEEES
jgi:DNA-binding MarR family transcriptional regulator